MANVCVTLLYFPAVFTWFRLTYGCQSVDSPLYGPWFLGDGVWEQDKSLLHSRQDFPLLRHPEGYKWAWRFWGLHDSPGLHTLHHTQRKTARKWVPFFFCHLYWSHCPVACSGCQSQISQVSRAGMMLLSWHSITQLTPFSAEQGTLGAQDLPDFSVEQIPLTPVSSLMGGLEGGGSNRTVRSHWVQRFTTQQLV